jgi:hypothetical protein
LKGKIEKKLKLPNGKPCPCFLLVNKYDEIKRLEEQEGSEALDIYQQ